MKRLAHIVAVGARTPIGLRATPAAAAVRAGLNVFGDHPFMIDQMGEKMTASLDAELKPGIFGTERLIRLIEPALREACEPLAGLRIPFSSLPLLLGLPEFRPGFSQADVDELLASLGRIQDLPVSLSQVLFYVQGHAAGLEALSHAVEQINAGSLDACLVGGVDSYFHPDTMEWLDLQRKLVGQVSMNGFVPGEGAGVCLVVSEAMCNELGIKSLARVREVTLARETKLDDSCFGEGITAAVRQAVSGLKLPDERINGLIGDINGERIRGDEWGFVCLRLSQYFDDPVAYLSPAENWGDMGAASSPLFIMLVCQAAAKGYSRGPRSLIWCGSDSGQRSVAVLETSNPE